MFDDWPLIEASFASQYGIRIDQEEDMSYQEFVNLVNGFTSESPLGKIVSVRAENDSDRLKSFTPTENKLRTEWRTKCNKSYVNNMSEEEKAKSTQALQNAFKQLAGYKP